MFVTEREAISTFGGAFDVSVPVGDESKKVQYFSGLLLRHRVISEGIGITLDLYDLIDEEAAPHTNVSQVHVFRFDLLIPQGFVPKSGPHVVSIAEEYTLRLLDIRWL